MTADDSPVMFRPGPKRIAPTLAALMLAGGTVGDLCGHKRIVLGGLGMFGLASLGCGLAPTVGLLVALRATQGVGVKDHVKSPGVITVSPHL